jgi:putative ABC transport system substrate-binding protein
MPSSVVWFEKNEVPMIERRQFILAASGFVFFPVTGSAQPTVRVVKVGTLINGGPGPIMEVFKAAFASLGYIEGRGLNFEHRFARGQLDRLPALARELVEVGVDVIFAVGGPASRAAKGATSTIPIVFSIVTDPLALGLVASMERPGGNATGITSLDADQADRQLDLLRSVFPKLARVGILSDDTIPGIDASGLAPIDRANSAAARKLGIEPIVRKVAGGPSPDYAAALDDMLKQGAEALLVLEVPMPLRDGKIVAETAATRRMPSVFPGGQSGAGGLIAYGTSLLDTWPRMPVLADKILKGTPPGQIPVETITRREFVVNLKTAHAIGVAIPEQVLKRADRVIE